LEEETEAAENLAGAADLDEEQMRGDVGRHDADVGLWDEEVEGAGGDEEDGEEEAREHGYYGTAARGFLRRFPLIAIRLR
jgi:hypothetical protein